MSVRPPASVKMFNIKFDLKINPYVYIFKKLFVFLTCNAISAYTILDYSIAIV